MSCHVPTMKSRYILKQENNYDNICSIEIIPAEIIYGSFHVDDTSFITSAIVDFEELENFIYMKSYDVEVDGLNINLPENIEHQFDNFTIRFFAMLKHNHKRYSTEYTSNVYIEFLYKKKTSINEMRSNISIFNMLLSILKLNYIHIEIIELYTCNTEDYEAVSENGSVLFHMNYSVDKVEEVYPTPFFRLKYEAISSIFNDIVNKWFLMYEKAAPIIELFYQILIKKSFDINKFLNLAQALEVFSNKYRSDKANALLDKFPNEKKEQTGTRLFHKVYDLFTHVNLCFGLTEFQIEDISHWIADTRNYYTHYGTTSKKKALTNPEDRYPINDLMMYLLTMVIYVELGIPIELIKSDFYHPFYESTLERVDKVYNRKKSAITNK